MADDLTDRPLAGLGRCPRQLADGIARHLAQEHRRRAESCDAQLTVGQTAHSACTAARTASGSGRTWKLLLIHSQRTTPSRSSTTVVGIGTSSPDWPPRACTSPYRRVTARSESATKR